ncbi:MAG: energy-coupling factor transporter ATPase [Candidatus Latescibacter sp.]|nr:energy-coupling factor transporter ATPase [Candidatus Latescibacter sp.]
MITLSHLTYSYPGQPPVLNDLSLSFENGVHTALMGPNGSGKSTLALLVKGLILPTGGQVIVDGLSASSGESERLEVMKRVGLVFQSPDNTIVATTVERELAFGLENLGIPGAEMRLRVDEALFLFDLEEYRHANPSHLSGGEKQRLALAAVMIMRPSHLILDEPTSLLDPGSRERILGLISDQARCGATVIHITQFALEALHADRAVVLLPPHSYFVQAGTPEESGICRDGAPSDVLRDTAGLGIRGIEPTGALFAKPLAAQIQKKNESAGQIIRLENVSYWYDRGLPFEKKALDAIDLTLFRGTSTVLLGPAGSGKTTLLEIAAGITAPDAGHVQVQGNPIRAMAFQFPEDQMFGDTVGEYVAFGPENVGIPKAEIARTVEEALRAVGLDPPLYRDRDPLALSGGEKRLAALAGVLAMRPEVLILDEPTAGLDLRGTALVAGFLKEYLAGGGTLLFSTHDFEAAGSLAEYALVLDHGRIETYGEIEDVFAKSTWLGKVKK